MFQNTLVWILLLRESMPRYFRLANVRSVPPLPATLRHIKSVCQQTRYYMPQPYAANLESRCNIRNVEVFIHSCSAERTNQILLSVRVN